MKHIVIGTAGHVDHGKTSLTRALTGIDTDRLREEQKRGITIEIGFAELVLPNGQTASIVDVPGHEKLVGNMLVGASGMDVVLMVVAADEGVMPQTSEHLGVLTLLGVQRGIVVMTKCDMVEPEWLDAICEETREKLQDTFLAGAPMVCVSSHTGAGLDALKEEIVRLIDGTKEKSKNRPFRLPVDRVFTVDGFGTVVTGTLAEGEIRSGDEVMIYPYGERARVRGVQSHDRSAESVCAGMRAALNLAGLGKHGIARGCTIAKADSMTLTARVDVRIEMLRDSPFPLKSGTRAHFYHDTHELLCKVRLLDADVLEAGESDFAQLLFEKPFAAKSGDHFVLRFFSPVVTIGGGTLLDLEAPHHKRFDESAIESLRARESGGGELVLRALAGNEQLSHAELAKSCAMTENELAAAILPLIGNGQLVQLGGGYLSRDSLEAFTRRAAELLAEYHTHYPLQYGMNLGEFRSKLFPKSRARFADDLIAHLAAEKILKTENAAVARYDFEPRYTTEAAASRARIAALYDEYGCQPENIADVEARLGGDTELVRQVMARMRTDGELVSLSPQLIIARAHYDRAKAVLYEMFSKKEEIALSDFRDALGISRKFALAFLEHWDANAVTRRRDDNTRVLLKKEM